MSPFTSDFYLQFYLHFYENIYLYLLCFFTLAFLTFFIYVKIYFPFWNLQPVRHPYDLFRFWIPTPRIILKQGQGIMGSLYDIRRRNRFCDFSLVSVLSVSDMTDSDVNDICLFLQSHFIRHPSDSDVLFLFYPLHFLAYHSSNSSLVSFIRSGTRELEFFVSSRPILLSFFSDKGKDKDNDKDKGKQFHVSFVDFLCVRDALDAMSLRKLLQTHFLRSCLLNGSVSVSSSDLSGNLNACIFRKEDEPSVGIVPFLEYSSDVYLLPRVFPYLTLPPGMRLIFLQNHSMHIWSDVILPQLHLGDLFSMVGVSSVESLNALIVARILFIGVLMEVTAGEDIVYAVYIFRDSRTVYSIPLPPSFMKGESESESEGALLHLIGSVYWCDVSLFSLGFLYCLRELMNNTKDVFRYLMVEDIAHNSLLLELPLFSNSTNDTHSIYYYSYNLLIPTLENSSCFLVF